MYLTPLLGLSGHRRRPRRCRETRGCNGWGWRSEALEEKVAHVGHADDLAALVEQRPAGIARRDRRGGLDVEPAAHAAVGLADDAFAGRTLEAQRIADGEDRVADADLARITNEQPRNRQLQRLLDLQERQIDILVEGDQLDLLVDLLLEALALALEGGDGDRLLVGDNVLIGDDEAVGMAEPAGTHAARGLDHDDGRAEFAGEGRHRLHHTAAGLV